ncbi:hypothetical protein Tco_0052034 [Tanacetum coccineum]
MLASQAWRVEVRTKPTEPNTHLLLQSPSHVDEAVHGGGRQCGKGAALTLLPSLDAECSPYAKEAMGDSMLRLVKRVSTPSYDLPLLGVNTPRSDEERIELKELMDMCTKLSDRVLDLENPRVESSEESLGEKDASKQERNSDNTEELNVAEDEHMFDLSDLAGVLFKEPSEPTTITTSRPQPQIPAKDKGKGIMQEPEKPVKVKGKDQIEYDADVVQRIQAELDEEARLEKERKKKLATSREREQCPDEEQARLLMKFITARKNFFVAKRVEEQRNKPPTKAEQRKKILQNRSCEGNVQETEGRRIIADKIIRADRSTKNYKIFSAMLDDFDRQDVLDLYRLLQLLVVVTAAAQDQRKCSKSLLLLE